MNVYISTSNKYLKCLKPFYFLFNRFWSDKQKVVVLGYRSPEFDLPSNFEFISMGSQQGPKFWSTDLARYFRSIDDQYFIYGLEDHFITRPVDLQMLEVMKDQIRKDSLIGRCGLTPGISERPHIIRETIGDIKIAQLKKNANYQVCTQYSIWNRGYFLKYVPDGLSPWDFEIKGSWKARRDNWKAVYGYKGKGKNKKFTVYKSEGIRNKKIDKKLDFGDLSPAVLEEMRKKEKV